MLDVSYSLARDDSFGCNALCGAHVFSRFEFTGCLHAGGTSVLAVTSRSGVEFNASAAERYIRGVATAPSLDGS
jgi:hypothetical protein